MSTDTNDPFSLHGRVAIVTGGNRGIGFGLAAGLARSGAAVMIAARDGASGEAAASQLRASGASRFAFHQANIAEPQDCQRLLQATAAAFGRVDILVNNAGIMIASRPEEMSFADFQAVLAVNLTGAFLCAQAAFPFMRDQGGGKVINTGSTGAIFGSETGAAYCASKGGLVQLTKSLAVAWGQHNIQVNAILPGYIESDMTSRADAARPGFLAATNARTPLGRRGRPEDLAGLAVFLASSASDYITGASIPADGGFSVQI